MAIFTRRVEGLERVFPSGSQQQHQPGELSEFVTLTHPFPGRLWPMATVPQFAVAAGPALQPSGTIIVAVAQGFVVEIIAGDASHDSATTRVISFFLVDPAGGTVTVARCQQPNGLGAFPLYANGGGAAGASFACFGCIQPIIVPAGWRLDFAGDTAGVAYSVTARVLGIATPLAQGGLILTG